jgi:hypothetical protein
MEPSPEMPIIMPTKAARLFTGARSTMTISVIIKIPDPPAPWKARPTSNIAYGEESVRLTHRI